MSTTSTCDTTNFFISYNYHDNAWAEWIAWQLENDGYSTVIQAWDFRVGSNFVLEMDRGLRQAQQVIAVLSPHYFESDFTPTEWAAKFAQDPKGSKVIPVQVQQVPLDGLFAAIVYVDLVDKNEVSATHELLAKIKQERAKPSRAPVFPGNHRPAFPGILSGAEMKKPVTFTAVITGTITEKDKSVIEAIVAHLRKISDDASLTLLEVQNGSIVLLLQCSFEGFERLRQLHERGLLKDISGNVLKELKTSDYFAVSASLKTTGKKKIDTETEDTTIYKVVVNHEEQYSIWPAHRESPLGWRDAGKSGTKEECLSYIKEVWTDMRPLSLRKNVEKMER